MPQTGDFKKDIELLLQNIARLYAYEGDAKLVSILANGKFTAYQSDYDNLDGGTYIYSVTISLPHHIYLEILPEEEDISKSILKKTRSLLHSYPNTWLGSINISAQLVEADNWQENAKDWLSGKGINNQGRVRSNNIANRECDGLLFRSNPEICFYKALKARGVAFAPLPVFVKGGKEYSRIEPDFIIIQDGVTACIEIDGDTVHRETPSEAQARTRILSNDGVIVERFPASECDNDSKAAKLVDTVIALIQKHKRNRV